MPEQTAKQTYLKSYSDVKSLLDHFNECLEQNFLNFHNTGSSDWGYAGSMNHYRETLINLVSEISNLSTDTIRGTLEDL